MSELKDFEDVKIVKRCEPKVVESESELPCKSFSFSGSFLKTVDEDILYVDSSIEVKSEEEKTPPNSPPIYFDEIPKQLSEQISLKIDDIEALSYYETFVISQGEQSDTRLTVELLENIESLTEVGNAAVMVEELSDGNILVFTTQQTFVNGERVCSECLSVVTSDLKLIHEKIIERKCKADTFTEQSLFIMSNDAGYRLVKTLTRDDFSEQFRADVEWTKSGDFLSRGANVLLIRKLVMEKFQGCVQAYCCDINGEFALCQYWFHKADSKLLNGEYTVVKRVDRLMIAKDDKIVKITQHYALDTCRMLKETINGQDIFTHCNPLSPQQRYTKDLQDNWEKDVELMSSYLEFKAKRKEELKRKFESPHVKFVLRDFIRTLIKCKPRNIVNFTMEFIEKLDQNSGNVNVQMQILKTADQRHQQN